MNESKNTELLVNILENFDNTTVSEAINQMGDINLTNVQTGNQTETIPTPISAEGLLISTMQAACDNNILGIGETREFGRTEKEAKQRLEKALGQQKTKLKKQLNCDKKMCKQGKCRYDFGKTDLQCEEKTITTEGGRTFKIYRSKAQFIGGCFCCDEEQEFF